MDWKKIEHEIDIQTSLISQKHVSERSLFSSAFEASTLSTTAPYGPTPSSGKKKMDGDNAFQSAKALIEVKSLVSENSCNISDLNEKVLLHEQQHRSALKSLSTISLRTQKLEHHGDELRGALENIVQEVSELDNFSKGARSKIQMIEQRFRYQEEFYAKQDAVSDLALMVSQTVNHLKAFIEEISPRIENASKRSFQSAAFSDSLLAALSQICQDEGFQFQTFDNYSNTQKKVHFEYSTIDKYASDSAIKDIELMLRSAIISVANSIAANTASARMPREEKLGSPSVSSDAKVENKYLDEAAVIAIISSLIDPFVLETKTLVSKLCNFSITIEIS